MKMKVEIRENSVILDGYVNVTARDSRVLPSARGKFIEQMMPTVFQRALDKADNVDLLFNHKADRKLGSIGEGNLKLYEDSIGLRAIATITDQEVISKAVNDELRGWSFGFITNSDKWEQGDISRRYVSDIDLLEVSILSITPAYIATSIEARGDEQVVKEQRFVEVESEKDNPDDETKEVSDEVKEEADETPAQEADEVSGKKDENDEQVSRSISAVLADLQNYLTIKR